jgi:hypothetical protein
VSLLLTVVAPWSIDAGIAAPAAGQHQAGRPEATSCRSRLGDVLAVFGLLVLETVSLLTPVLCRPAHLLEADGAGQGDLLQLLRRDPLGARVRRAAAVVVRHLLLGIVPSWWCMFRAIALAQVVLMWLMFLFILLLQCAMYAGYRTFSASRPGRVRDK